MADKFSMRARYITANEKLMLLTLIEDKSNILFNKSHDFRIIKRKKEAWEEVTNQFNAAGYGQPRSQQQLKKMWENVKLKAKREHVFQKREIMRTGGGAPPRPEDPETTKILTIINDDLDGEENELDCDAVQNAGQPRSVIGIGYDGHEFEIPVIDSNTTKQHTNKTIVSNVAYTSPNIPLTSTVTNTTQNTPVRSSTSQEYDMIQDNPGNTVTSIQLDTRDITSEHTPTTTQTNSAPPQKRRRTRKFTQEASFEASLEMQRKEHEKTMESLQLDIEIKKEKLKQIKRGNEDANLHLQAHQTWIDVGKKLLEVTGELGKATKLICDKLNGLQ